MLASQLRARPTAKVFCMAGLIPTDGGVFTAHGSWDVELHDASWRYAVDGGGQFVYAPVVSVGMSFIAGSLTGTMPQF